MLGERHCEDGFADEAIPMREGGDCFATETFARNDALDLLFSLQVVLRIQLSLYICAPSKVNAPVA